MIDIRDEQPGDIAAIREVNRRAFGQNEEAAIVDALRSNGAVLCSLVAVLDGRVVGYILYSPVQVGDVMGAALGPMAVLPEHQRQGIGSRLVETGKEQLARAGYPLIVVLGHAAFYPRFGFKPGSVYGISCEWEVPDEVFMVLALNEAAMSGAVGVAKYRAEFSTAG